MARICIDMDGVLADTYQKFVDAYEREFGRELLRTELLGKKVYDLEGASHIRDLMYEPGFFRQNTVLPGAVAVVEHLYERHEVFVVTSTTEFRHSMLDKWEWLAEHFPFIHHSRMVFCGDKGIVHGDYMIDDKVSNLEGFNGTGLLFTSPDNHYDTGYRRVDSWGEVRDFFADRDRPDTASAG